MRKTDRPPLFHVWLVVYRAGLELEPCGGWPNGDHVSVEGDAPAGEPATDCVEVFQFVVPNPCITQASPMWLADWVGVEGVQFHGSSLW